MPEPDTTNWQVHKRAKVKRAYWLLEILNRDCSSTYLISELFFSFRRSELLFSILAMFSLISFFSLSYCAYGFAALVITSISHNRPVQFLYDFGSFFFSLIQPETLLSSSADFLISPNHMLLSFNTLCIDLYIHSRERNHLWKKCRL